MAYRSVFRPLDPLAHVHTLHARDNYPMLDEYGCYVLIASAATTLRLVLGSTQA